MVEKTCDNCIRKYCDIKNKYVTGCNQFLAGYRGNIKNPGIREKQFRTVKNILEELPEVTFSELTILAQKELAKDSISICRQTVSKLAQDIGQVTGHKKQGHILKRVCFANDF